MADMSHGASNINDPATVDPLAQVGPSILNWLRPPEPAGAQQDVVVDMGWGRLIFAHTFADNDALLSTILAEGVGKRDVAFYVRDPHVLVSMAPHELFLDPSHTYRLWLHRYQRQAESPSSLLIRPARSIGDAAEINRIYGTRHMVKVDPDYIAAARHADRAVQFIVAEDPHTGEIVGSAAGVDHRRAFADAENGASLWSIAVDPQASCPGIGRALVQHMVDRYAAAGRAYVDLSVMHDNTRAIGLYERVGFERVPVFCLKRKNAINESLFVPAQPEAKLNPYARIIVDEARRRGIGVEVLDEEANYFALTCGGRRIVCRESLSELTSAVAMSRCDDKRCTLRLLDKAGLRVPVQQMAGLPSDNHAFLDRFKRVVVKPARGEQGRGISVDLRTPADLDAAIELARQECQDVVLEQFCEGVDLRIVVIGFKVVAAAIRRPAQVVGDGRHTVRELIEQHTKRRMAATGGESRVPMDAETDRCVRAGGYEMTSVLPDGVVLPVRKAANLHTGGTIHDVTAQLHPVLADAAERAARAIDIPVTGLDFLVPAVDGPDYVIIEANERPGLANHEPQPTAERFVDLLFPQMMTAAPE
ncbi:MAG TPA: N-acetylglutaminylglutamine synthetase [Tepidisphaeraceae bacterium]|nr:N-acetylglutaminylglutamine synthetase [Tepidisphaeraceae bacterium]